MSENWRHRQKGARDLRVAQVMNGAFKAKRKRSPRRLEPHEVVAKLKARKSPTFQRTEG